MGAQPEPNAESVGAASTPRDTHRADLHSASPSTVVAASVLLLMFLSFPIDEVDVDQSL